MILHLNGVINQDLLEKLIDAYNALPPETTLEIYLCSEGGENSTAAAMIDLINEHSDITVVKAYNLLASNGFKLFYEVTCEKYILPETIGMYHLTKHPSLAHYEGNTKHNADYDEFIKKGLNNYSYMNQVKNLVNFTEAELKNIKLNYDVWFDTKRLMTMLKYNKTYLNL